MMNVWKVLSVGLIVSVLGLAGCGGDDDDLSPEDAQANLCESLGTLESEITSLTDLSGDSSVGDLESARDSIRDAVGEVEDAAQDVEDAETEALEDSVDDLNSAIDDLDDDVPISEGLASIQSAVTAVVAAWGEIFAFAECPA